MKAIVKIPGKIMLAGEYSILYAHKALALSVSCDADLELTFSDLQGVYFTSNLWAKPRLIPMHMKTSEKESVILSTVFRYCNKHQILGLDLKVDSKILPEYGMGSSSALRLGVALAIESLKKGRTIDAMSERWRIAKEVIEDQARFQGQASGYDVAVQLAGGLLYFSRPYGEWPNGIEKINPGQTIICDILRIFIGGKGAPTKSVLNDTLDFLQRKNLKEVLAEKADALIEAMRIGLIPPYDARLWQNIYAQMGSYRDLFCEANHFPSFLHAELQKLKGIDERWSFKFSGAGGEDAILLFGPKDETSIAAQVLLKNGWKEFNATYPNAGAEVRMVASDGEQI